MIWLAARWRDDIPLKSLRVSNPFDSELTKFPAIHVDNMVEASGCLVFYRQHKNTRRGNLPKEGRGFTGAER